MSTDGYHWWYVDATSDDGQHGLTIIGFVGSVFSPYYADARRRGRGDPENHCAINVALYGAPRRWAMTERGRNSTLRTGDRFQVGASAMTWHDTSLRMTIDERCAPIPFKVRGQVTLEARHLYDDPIGLDPEGRHYWQAVAPQARVQVDFEYPRLAWSGPAYHDMNWGHEPLEQGFTQWSWLRALTRRGTEVQYHGQRRDGSRFSFGRCFSKGTMTEQVVPPEFSLQRGLWGMQRTVLSEHQPELLKPLVDAPFYTRNHIGLTLHGEKCEAYHESLSLDRFSSPVVQMMLRLRMRRRA